MLRRCLRVVESSCLLLLLGSLAAHPALAQFDTATISGQVVDPSGLSVTSARVTLVDIDRDTSASSTTNGSGLYTFPSVRPGRYRMEVTKDGFRIVNVTGLTVNVQDHLEQNFKLAVGSVSESVTVEGQASPLDRESATVSTVVDRHFAENLPMNGRSFQTLIQLTPGVVPTVSQAADSGQFSVNGQRTNANYWMVDGVSANIGIAALSPQGGEGFAGSTGSFSVLGGTNSLVSVDALQEFRIQTSTYAPEFGRTPGGQISIVTRSGTNQLHGTLFDYFRNDALDANDWFANRDKLAKPQERQNDFGGIFSGPVLRDRTFFFFSYEGLRLRLPQVAETTVPSIAARRAATPAMQPLLNAYPLPLASAADNDGVSPLNASFSNSATLDAYSIRIDHKVNDKLNFFGRYNYSPSKIVQRGGLTFNALSMVEPSQITTQTATIGSTWATSSFTVNDLRFNYSRTSAKSDSRLDNFSGAIPLTSPPFPSPYTSHDAYFYTQNVALSDGSFFVGKLAQNVQRQINIVDSLSMQKGSHALKVGVDFRRLSPIYDPPKYQQNAYFADVPSAETGNLLFSSVFAQLNGTLLFHNLGVFVQDTWRVIPRLTVTYGLRWDIDFAPSSISGPSFAAVTNFNKLANLALAPTGTPPFRTTYGNVAPRIGLAYQLSANQEWQTVLRGGFGVFYDLATQQTGIFIGAGYPFGSNKFPSSGTFPLDPASAAPKPIVAANLSSDTLFAFDPNVKLPYTLEWNIAVEQTLGKQQAVSASYLGSVGRRLIQSEFIFLPNPNLGSAILIGNSATSDYNALQLQLQRRLVHGLQALASYSWSHSIDTGSAGSYANGSNTLVPGVNPNLNRGDSDFDIRNAFSAGVTYDVPAPRINTFTNAILRGWSLQNVIQARSAPPVNVFNSIFFEVLNGSASVRPDVVPGLPLYLFGSQYPGGKAINHTPGAVAEGCPDGSQSIGPFCPPPLDMNGTPLRQGNLGRNALRGFGATQWDFAVHRDFPVHESLKLQFRAELFNVLNHPNFSPPVADLSQPNFGRSTSMLGRGLNNNPGGGGFSALYQVGGPRSIQLALKLQF